jgi:hypothetical protein
MTTLTPVTSSALLVTYLDRLVSQFFKILPMREQADPSLPSFMRSLQREMLGCQVLVSAAHHDARYTTLLAILQYMIDAECTVAETKTEVFKAIDICKKAAAAVAREGVVTRTGRNTTKASPHGDAPHGNGN